MMNNTKIMWFFGFLLSMTAALFAHHYFSQAFPIVGLDISMDRQQALAKAGVLAKHYKLGPQDHFMQAALFGQDSTTQVYVELEAGGATAFHDLVTKGFYSPYTWQVRHCKQHDVHEISFFFTPDGKIYGFDETVAESDPGKSLSAEEARTIAEQEALTKWEVPLAAFSLVESSKETRPNGRTDHIFVYERSERLKDAYYRLTLEVSGDRLIAVRYSVKVPETFTHRYIAMRSANNTIATAAQFIMMFIYMLLIGLTCLFILQRRRWLLWRPSIMLGGFIAVVVLLMRFNQFPMLWMFYPTTSSTATFTFNQLLQMAIGFIMNWLSVTTIIVIAEGLTRKVFGNHVQFWSLWKKDVASSWQLLSQTAASILGVSFLLAYQVLMYMMTSRYLGWWTPSSALTDPNILATYIPWLSAAGIAIQAGILEECLFRAVPLAAAAWLGERWNKRNLFIAIAFVMQMLVFGAAHANYPAQPAYARLIELLFFSVVLGWTYLKYGLYPAILMHILFDLVLGAIPLFLMGGSFALLNQVAIILIGLIPIIVVLIARFRFGSWHQLQSTAYNSFWAPFATSKKELLEACEDDGCAKDTIVTRKKLVLFVVLGALGLGAWIRFAKFKSDAPGFSSSIIKAKQDARNLLKQKGIELDDSWTALISLQAAVSDNHRFIWQKGGPALYQSLLGAYLTMPHWLVRFVHFSGTLSERAHEYSLRMAPDGSLIQLWEKRLAEDPGVTLDEKAAKIMVDDIIKNEFELDPSTLNLVAASATKQPARVDWTFTLQNLAVTMPEGSQARLVVSLIGDAAAGYYRTINVPEEWTRDKAARDAITTIIKIICGFLFVLLLVIAFIILFRRRQFPRNTTKVFLVGFGVSLCFWIFLMWQQQDASLFYFNAQEPYYHQLFRLIGYLSFSVLAMAAGVTLFIVASLGIKRPAYATSRVRLFIGGICLGLCFAGLLALVFAFQPSLQPFWGDYNALNSCRPWSTAWMMLVLSYLLSTSMVLFILNLLYSVDRLRWGKLGVFCLLLGSGFLSMGMLSIMTIQYWLLSGLIAGVAYIIAYFAILRYTTAVVPLCIAVLTITAAVQQGMLGLYP